MSNPFIPLATQALNANLSKNELRLFLALTIQTLGYHKEADPLTDKRIAGMTGIRVDHLRPAIERFLNYGLFEREPHPQYDYHYRICDAFLDDDKVYPPTLPRHRETSAQRSVNDPNDGVSSSPNSGDSPNDGVESHPDLGEFPNDGGHTIENPNNKKTPQQKPTEKNVCQKKPQQQQTEKNAEPIITQAQPKPSVTISMSSDSLPEDFIIESSQPIRLEICAKKDKQVTNEIADTKKKLTTSSVTNDAGASGIVFPRWHMGTSGEASSFPRADVGMQSATLQRCFDDAGASGYVFPRWNVGTSETSEKQCDKKPTADLTASVATSLVKPTDKPTNDEKPCVVVDEKKVKKATQSPAKNKLPKAVGEENYNACNRFFQPLNAQQQKDVLTVFYHNLKTSQINSKAGYFIGLCKRVTTKAGLTLPSKEVASGPLSPEQFAIHKQADAEREKRALLWSDYQGLKNQAALLNKSEAETAQLMGFEEAYAMFGQQDSGAT